MKLKHISVQDYWTPVVNLWEQTCFTNWCYFIYQGHCGRGERSGMMVRHTTDYWIHPWNVLKKSTNYSVLCQICKQVKFLIWSRKCELPGLLFVPQTSVCSDFSSETSWAIPLLCCMGPTQPCGLLCIFCIETKRESEGVKMIKFNRNTLCILAFFAFRHLRMSSLEDITLKRFFLDIYLPFRL